MLSKCIKKLAFLMFTGVMLGVAVAEAGTIPTSSVPLYTYATKKIYCYNSPGGAQKGYIDPGDDITITKVQSNGWVYGNYPTPSGRVSRWFKASDLLADRNANYTRYAPKATTNVYRNSSHKTTMGSVNNNETITVVGGSGNSRQIIYKLSNGKGYKMGWFPYWDAWTYDQAFGKKPPVINNAAVSVDAKLNGLIGSWKGKKWDNRESSKIGSTCFGFANYIFRELNGVIAGSSYNSGRYKLTNKGYGVKEVYTTTNATYNSLHNFLPTLKTGAFIQGNKATGNKQHSMIFCSYNANSKTIKVFDANWATNPDNVVRVHDFTLSKFIERFPRVSFYQK